MAPFTGKEFLESLRDGREIWIYGQRVPDVTTHPAFRNPARMLARLYDALHDPAQRDVLTCPTDTGSGGVTHRYFRAPASAAELVASRDAIAAWARITYGWMGRSPDYKAAFLATLGGNADFYAPYQDNARRWYRAAQERVLFLNHALVQRRSIVIVRPTGGRCVRARRARDRRGLIVSGPRWPPARRDARLHRPSGHHADQTKAFGAVFTPP
jgi:4-hydroxyphenylacetate 3-monooxygenase